MGFGELLIFCHGHGPPGLVVFPHLEDKKPTHGDIGTIGVFPSGELLLQWPVTISSPSWLLAGAVLPSPVVRYESVVGLVL